LVVLLLAACGGAAQEPTPTPTAAPVEQPTMTVAAAITA
jgi:outer membrane biogenesis lipoprotein LolB